MTNLEKLSAIKAEILESDLSPIIKDMLYLQVTHIQDCCAEFNPCGCETTKIFKTGILYGMLRIFNSEIIPMFSSMTFWIDPDVLITELEENNKKEAFT